VERKGTVTCERAGDRWTAEVRVSEGERHWDVSLNRSFPTEAAARRAGDALVTEWIEGRQLLRDVLLRELAGTYRMMRERHKTMHPPAVPATRASWETAIATWEQLQWIGASDAARQRDHVQAAFAAEARRAPPQGQIATGSGSA
jgi:hypothetical protein